MFIDLIEDQGQKIYFYFYLLTEQQLHFHLKSESLRDIPIDLNIPPAANLPLLPLSCFN